MTLTLLGTWYVVAFSRDVIRKSASGLDRKIAIGVGRTD
jgi:hypothetical protein